MSPTADHTAPVVDLRTRRSAGLTATLDALVPRIACGDAEAFERFYDLVVTRVHGVIRSVLRDPAQADEVTQEVMVELWRTAPNFEVGRGSAQAWAVTIAHRRAVDRVRSSEASKRRDTQHAVANADVDLPGPEQLVEARLESERVTAALAELTAAQRQSIELAYFRGLSHVEVATLLDLPLGTVKTRIRDGLIRLRDRLGVTP